MVERVNVSEDRVGQVIKRLRRVVLRVIRIT